MVSAGGGVAVLMFLCSAFFAQYNPDFHHDGLVAKPAFDFLNGKILYNDSFNMYGFLTPVLQALGMKIFGENLYAIRLMTCIFYTVFIMVYYNIFY